MSNTTKFKTKLHEFLRKPTNFLARVGVTPNQVTLFTLFCSVAIGTSLALFPYSTSILLIYPFFLIIRIGLNAMDGMLARKMHIESKLGILLNELCNVISEIALLLPFALTRKFDSALMVIIVLMIVITEFCSLTALLIGSTRRQDGPMNGEIRAIVFAILALLLGLNVPLHTVHGWIEWAILLMLSVTIINRSNKALRIRSPL